jgi:hypothetical protein
LDSATQRLTEINPAASLPPAFDPWFQRCVNRDSAARFASAGDAARELAAVFGTQSKNPPALPFDATMVPQNARSQTTGNLGGAPQTGAGLSGGGLSSGSLGGTASGAATPAPLSQSVHIQRSKAPWVLGLAALGAIGVVVALLSGKTTTEPNSNNVASQPVVAPEPTEPKTVVATLQFEPNEAIVKVNGELRSTSNGTFKLEGPKNTEFSVELRVGEKTQTTAVRLLDTGSLDPAKVVLIVPPPAPSESSASSSAPKPAVRVVAPTKKQVKAPPPPPPKTAEPAPPPPAKKKVPFDPLAGPRVH